MSKRIVLFLLVCVCCLVSYASEVISVENNTAGGYAVEGDAGEVKFGEPVVTVQNVVDDGGGHYTYTDVTGSYNITYSILGGDGFATEGVTTTDSRGVVIVTDATTGTYVEKYYGDVILGRAGTVKVKVIATPKSGGTTLTSEYTITINSLTSDLTFIPSFSSNLVDGHDGSVTLVSCLQDNGYGGYYLSSATGLLPDYKVTTMVSAVTTDITDHFDVAISYSGNSNIAYNSTKASLDYAGLGNQWQTKTQDEINGIISDITSTYGTLTYTFTPKAEYAGYYPVITKTIDARLLCKTDGSKQTLHLSLQREQILQETVTNNEDDNNLPVIHVYKYGQSDINPSNHYQYYTPIPSLLTSDGTSVAINSQRATGGWGDFQLIYQIVKDSTYYDNCTYAPFFNIEEEVAQPAGEKTGLTINDYMYSVAKPGLVKVAVYGVLQGTYDDNGYGYMLKNIYQPVLDDNDQPVTIIQNGATYTVYTEPVYFYIDVMKRQPHLKFSPDPNDIVFVKGDLINIPSRFDVSAYIDDSHNGEAAELIWGSETGNDHFAYSFFMSDRNADNIIIHDWPYANGEEEWEKNGGDIYSYKYRHIVLENYGGYAGISDIRLGDSIQLSENNFVVVTADNIEELKLVHPKIQVGDYEMGIVYNSMKGYGNESWTFEFLQTGTYNIPYTVRPWNHVRWDNSTEIGVTFRYSEDEVLATKIKLGYTFQVADLGQSSFDEPVTKVVVPAWNDYDVTDYYNLSYEIFSDPSNTGTSVDPTTGEVTIGSDAIGDVVIKVSGVRNSMDINYGNPEDAYYTIRIVEPASRAKWEVISTCKTNGCEVHTTNPRFADMTEANGRMHFLTAGLIYGGTVVEGVPGISMTIGAPAPDATLAADWVTVATSENTPKCCAHETSSVIVKSTAVLDLDDDEIPSAGAFYQFVPTVNGFLTIDAKLYKDNTIVLITRDNEGTCYKEVFCNPGDKAIVYPKATYDDDGNLLGDYTFSQPLIAGNTYYLYDITDGGNLNLHGFSYQPAFVFDRTTTQAESETPLTASLFMNGLSSSVPSLYEGNNSNVTFSVSDAHSIGATPADYVSVDENGALDPQKMTLDSNDDIFKLRVTATVASTDATLGDCVSKTPYYDVQIIDIPTFVIGDATSYSELNIQSGTEVTTTNISTDITMTFGGWHDKDNTYHVTTTSGVVDRTDTWEYKSSLGPASRIGSELDGDDPYYNRTIDGFDYYNAAKQNPVDELNMAAVNSGEVYTFASGTEYEISDKRYNTTYTLPCRGAYVKFEPRESGTLMVYLVQNGSVDYHYGVTSVGTSYQLRWRPLYITDETGRPVTMVNEFGNVGKYLPTGNDAHNAGSFTLGISRCNKDENVIKNSWDYENADASIKMPGCYFDWSGFRGTVEDRQHLLDAWPAKGERESIIRLSTGGFALPHKAYVRYAFHVKAGKTYFVFQPGSKFEFGGFSFVPAGFPTECKYAITSKPGALVYNENNQEKNYAGGSTSESDLTFTWENPANFNKSLENRMITINDRRKSELTSSSDKDELKARTFTAGSWEGICLPFSVSSKEAKRVFGDDYVLVTCDGVNEDKALHFVRHANTYIEAGRPYLIKPSKNGTFSFNNVTIEGDVTVTTLAAATLNVTDPSRFNVDINNGEYTFKGTYMRETMPAMSFFAKDDGLYRYSQDAKIGGYRSYFYLNSTSAGAKAMTFVIDDLSEFDETAEMTTGIILIREGGEDNVEILPNGTEMYNVSGQKIASGSNEINNAPRGVYIINKQKFVK